MNRACCGVWTLITLAIGATLFCLSASAGEERPIKIVGTIVETETDEDGNILAIELETDEGAYSIELSGVGEELLSYVGETVEIHGVLTEDDGGMALGGGIVLLRRSRFDVVD